MNRKRRKKKVEKKERKRSKNQNPDRFFFLLFGPKRISAAAVGV
jgi:hypothetical protein